MIDDGRTVESVTEDLPSTPTGAVCWLAATCTECGALIEGGTCWNCGARRAEEWGATTRAAPTRVASSPTEPTPDAEE